MRGKWKEVPAEQDGKDFYLDRSQSISQSSLHKQYRAKAASNRRLAGRPSIEALQKMSSRDVKVSAGSEPAPLQPETPGEVGYESTTSVSTRHGSQSHSHMYEGILNQVSTWMQQEVARRHERKHHLKHKKQSNHLEIDVQNQRRGSDSSAEGTAALGKLQELLQKSMAAMHHKRHRPRKSPSLLKLRRASTSDGEHLEGEPLVPHADAFLDNSKTLVYSSSTADITALISDSERPPMHRQPSAKCQDAWRTFKYEVLRITHTLRLKGWRRIPLEMSRYIEVQRLSGALTNCVYVVSPPKDLPPQTPLAEAADKNDLSQNTSSSRRPPPPKILLRIYGSQVDHLIDRTSELAILRRLAKKRIGPRMLGTFTNGRFEEFFDAETLTAKDLREPETSKQIAKRMRELHDGVELLREEREGSPFVWQNVDKWLPRCSKVARWLDKQVVEQAKKTGGEPVYVFGAPSQQFFDVLATYRKWLYEQYGGAAAISAALVFAHNDTQYGNILRLKLDGESSLLRPSNAHKQLIVIDFEYANANLPAIEFANHFSEWCYNYHDPKKSWQCDLSKYPSVEEQGRFIRSYVRHTEHQRDDEEKSEHDIPEDEPTPHSPELAAAEGSVSSSLISSLMLDSRFTAPQSQRPPSRSAEKQQQQSRDLANVGPLLAQLKLDPAVDAHDAAREELLAAEMQRLLNETRIWRLVNSALWTMWGVMQAEIPDLPADIENDDNINIETESCTDADDESVAPDARHATAGKAELRQEEEDVGEPPLSPTLSEQAEEPEFDYLAYSRSRAMFFWGDAVGLGIVRREDLPKNLASAVRVLEY